MSPASRSLSALRDDLAEMVQGPAEDPFKGSWFGQMEDDFRFHFADASCDLEQAISDRIEVGAMPFRAP